MNRRATKAAPHEWGFKQVFLLEAALPGAAFVALAFMPGRKAATSQTPSYWKYPVTSTRKSTGAAVPDRTRKPPMPSSFRMPLFARVAPGLKLIELVSETGEPP